MASPEEMLSHPATGLIHDFLGKHMPEQSAADLKVKEFMRTGVYTVEQTRGINECISKMQRHQRGHLDCGGLSQKVSGNRVHHRYPSDRACGGFHRLP